MEVTLIRKICKKIKEKSLVVITFVDSEVSMYGRGSFLTDLATPNCDSGPEFHNLIVTELNLQFLLCRLACNWVCIPQSDLSKSQTHAQQMC